MSWLKFPKWGWEKENQELRTQLQENQRLIQTQILQHPDSIPSIIDDFMVMWWDKLNKRYIVCSKPQTGEQVFTYEQANALQIMLFVLNKDKTYILVKVITYLGDK